MAAAGNIFQDLPEAGGDEQFADLLSAPHVKIERIVSTGQVTAPGRWYDQPRAEWVLVVQGAARLRFEGDAAPRVLAVGDYLDIPARCRHRVEWTDPAVPTIWLAVHHD